ncbi:MULTISPECIES: hypothetical protein [unclassified Sporosarcina]|uniref:hypothetical protein n=1 Tax=unclassified Sporosarcina TaxID=2647733 RepID=UPI000C16D55B|nr:MULTISPECIES: hypothetical protein [unclassified Sporosarcina]PID06396.1 hypothetical protein CSV66_03610 [Sporosarcina sp. P30]PID09590.1 hypothetical protein CSV65_03610 [Sporosarcina sp. P31]PID13167.1 hypothetical protein CSV64_01645 [Sporosarcina sp. P32b]
MKTTTGLYLFFIAIHLVNLANITLSKGDWNGITMWLSTGLFIAGTAYYALNKSATGKAK